MKNATVENILSSFLHPVLTTVQGDPDYQTIHAIRKSLQANSQAIDTHLGGGTLGHLGLVISDDSYAMIAPNIESCPTLWTKPDAPGRASANTDGTAAQISAASHNWEEYVRTYQTYTSVQHALKKQIISVFEHMHLDILNDNMVGYAIILARYMLDHLFETYGNITAVDLEINFEHMHRAWDPQQPVESLFKHIQDCADYSEAGGSPNWPPATNQLCVCKNICNRAPHECMSSVERETYYRENLDPIQIPFYSSSLSTQADARRILCHIWIPLRQCRSLPQRGSNG
jgi:hypothetical protein